MILALNSSLVILTISQVAPLAERGIPFAEATGGGSCPNLTLQFPVSPKNVLELESKRPNQYRAVLVGTTLAREETLATPDALRDTISAIRLEPDGSADSVLVIELDEGATARRITEGGPQSLVLALSGKGCQASSSPAAATAVGSKPVDRERLEELDAKAEEAMRVQDDAAAAALVAEMLSYEENELTPRARELSGALAERAGRSQEARAIFEAYLRDYPDNEGVPRVRMRLNAIGEGALDRDTEQNPADGSWSAATSNPESAAWRADVRGSFSQFYIRDESRATYLETTNSFPPDFVDHRINVDETLTNGDVTAVLTDGKTVFEMRATAGYASDVRPVQLVGGTRNGGSYGLLDQVYASVGDSEGNYKLKLGRQKEYGLGVFGRFDGASAMVRFNEQFGMRVLWGHPVWSERHTSINDAQEFTTVSLDYASPDKKWSGSVYLMDQRAAGETDRRALGAQLRVSGDDWFVDSLIDYDMEFGEVNAAYLNATKIGDGGANYSLTAQIQHYPTLSLTNAILGQEDPRLESILDLVDVGTAREIALDRTLISRSLTASATIPLSSQWQLTTDVGVSSLSGDPGSLGIPAYLETGTEYHVAGQLTGYGLFTGDDTLIARTRFEDLQKSQIYSAAVDYRIPLSTNFYVAPHLRVAFREQKDEPGNATYVTPSIRAVWKVAEGVELDARVGGNFVDQNYVNYDWSGSRREKSFVAHVGYVMRF
jgi:hypothetical protein